MWHTDPADQVVCPGWAGWPSDEARVPAYRANGMHALDFWRSPLWRKVLRVDSDHAEAEGLAAGTGLITGGLAEGSAASTLPCPRCGKVGEVVAIDLVAQLTHRRCWSCAHSWVTSEIVPSRATKAVITES